MPQGLESYGAYVQDRLQLFRQISASSLSFLFTCPYRFLLHKLQLREDLSEEKQKTLWEGRWLHQIFEAFYTGQIEGKRIITPLPRKLTLKTNEIIEFAVERLSVITKKSIPSDLQGSPLQLHLAKYAWPRFAKHWASFFRQVNTQESIFETQAVLCEHAVDTQSHSLKLWEESVQITGSLDNFVSFNGHFILTDYKRKGVDSVAQVQKGLAPQLPLYALAMQENPQTCELMTKGVSGYWSIIEGKWYPRAKSSGPSDLSSETKLCSSQTPIIEQQIRTLQALWQEVVQSFVVEKKPFQPQVSEACDFCSFHGICRKNDPTIQASRQQLETSNG